MATEKHTEAFAAAERASPIGRYAVVWVSPDTEAEVGHRYTSMITAEREVDRWYRCVYADTPIRIIRRMVHPCLGEIEADGTVRIIRDRTR